MKPLQSQRRPWPATGRCCAQVAAVEAGEATTFGLVDSHPFFALSPCLYACITSKRLQRRYCVAISGQLWQLLETIIEMIQ